MQEQIIQTLNEAHHILVIQADNPDADSLGSALALEELLENAGKTVTMYCGVAVPEYLRYLAGWDRVSDMVPADFDTSIIVDASTMTLLEKLLETTTAQLVARRPCIVLDHHAMVEHPIDFTEMILTDTSVSSTGELVYLVSKAAKWDISTRAAEFIMSAILGDTQGLSNDLTSAHTYRVMADLTELGANRPQLEELRREFGKMDPEIYAYKGTLIGRTELLLDGTLALIHIPHDEIRTYSPLYNPAPLIQFDMLQIKGVKLAVVIKTYDDGHITGALRANNGTPVAGVVASELGGGGHEYASGFKILNAESYTSVKQRLLEITAQKLGEL